MKLKSTGACLLPELKSHFAVLQKKEKKNKFCVVTVYLNSIFGLLLLAKKYSGLFIYFLSSWTFGLCKLNFQGFWFFF